MSVVVFGEAMIELSDVQAHSARIGVAGDTFNTAVYLARSGLDVAYATALGDDPFSERVRDALADEGIAKDLALTAPGRTVGLYAITLDDKGERSFTYWRGQSAARAFFTAPGGEAALDAMSRASLLYFSGITLSLYTPEERARLLDAVKRQRSNGGRFAFDMNYRPRGWPDKSEAQEAASAAYALADIALPTFEDDQLLFGFGTPDACLAHYAALGVSELALKCGPDGALLSGSGWSRPPEVVSPLDTTGAGDSFNAAYLAARFRGKTPDDAAQAGHKLAAEVLRHYGAILPRSGAAQS